MSRLLLKYEVSEVSLYLGILLIFYWYILMSNLEINILVVILLLIGVYLVVSALRRR